MRRKAIIVLTLAIILIAAAVAFAHPPKSISANWDASSYMLKVTAEHNVNDPTKHYVLSLTISQGSKQLFQKQYTGQSSAERFQDSVTLEGLTSGVKLRIQVVCNIMGVTEAEYTIP